MFDPATGRSFTVNDTGAAIIKALQQGQSQEAIRRQLAAEFEVSAQPLERDVMEFLASLREQLA